LPLISNQRVAFHRISRADRAQLEFRYLVTGKNAGLDVAKPGGG
jgi:hypothetical protein